MNENNCAYRFYCIGLLLLAAVLAVPGYSAGAGAGKPVKFVAHRIGQFRSEACGVADFNRDGKLDIIAGPYWYERRIGSLTKSGHCRESSMTKAGLIRSTKRALATGMIL